VRELTRKNGVRLERHLCERCAREQGITAGPNTSLEEILKQFVIAPSGQPAAEPGRAKGATPAPVCPSCGLSFSDFKQSGNLGCAACYGAFETQLTALLERAQEGAALHVGKSPRRAHENPPARTPGIGGPGHSHQERLKKITTLRRQLDEAVRGEQYERAAKLRDEMRRLGDDSPVASKSKPGTPSEG